MERSGKDVEQGKIISTSWHFYNMPSTSDLTSTEIRCSYPESYHSYDISLTPLKVGGLALDKGFVLNGCIWFNQVSRLLETSRSSIKGIFMNSQASMENPRPNDENYLKQLDVTCYWAWSTTQIFKNISGVLDLLPPKIR